MMRVHALLIVIFATVGLGLQSLLQASGLQQEFIPIITLSSFVTAGGLMLHPAMSFLLRKDISTPFLAIGMFTIAGASLTFVEGPGVYAIALIGAAGLILYAAMIDLVEGIGAVARALIALVSILCGYAWLSGTLPLWQIPSYFSIPMLFVCGIIIGCIAPRSRRVDAGWHSIDEEPTVA
jgi:hypothetical protein